MKNPDSLPISNTEHTGTSNPLERIGAFGKKWVLTLGLLTGASTALHAQEASYDSYNMDMEAQRIKTEMEFQQSQAPQANPSELQKARDYYVAERDWLIATVQSPEYKQRLIGEGLPETEVDVRIANIVNTPIEVQKGKLPYLYKDSISTTSGQNIWTSKGNTIYLPSTGYQAPRNFGLTIHEETHAATEGNDGMSAYAKNLYEEAFYYPNNIVNVDTLLAMPGIIHNASEGFIDIDPNAPTETKQQFDEYVYWFNYESDPTELDGRKKVLEYEMDLLGMKKYGEPFTQEHLDQLYLEFNNLSPNSQEFIDHIQKEYIIEIMNTIADTGTENNQTTTPAG